MIQIPLSALPNQILSIVLNEQNCRLQVRARGHALYLDLEVNNQPVQYGALMIPKAPLITVSNTTFHGQLRLIDSKSKPDYPRAPYYQGLGTRFLLYYLTPEEELSLTQEQN